jgi:hypothetical protein
VDSRLTFITVPLFSVGLKLLVQASAKTAGAGGKKLDNEKGLSTRRRFSEGRFQCSAARVEATKYHTAQVKREE